jgi:hypothetical protein
MSQPGEDQDEKFTWGADVLLSQCILCRHAAAGPAPICAAFPGQIPAEIMSNELDHRKPHLGEDGQPDDMGIPLERSITFEPRPEVNHETLIVLFKHLDQLKHE